VDHSGGGKTVTLLQTRELGPCHVAVPVSPRRPTPANLSRSRPKFQEAGVVSSDPVIPVVASQFLRELLVLLHDRNVQVFSTQFPRTGEAGLELLGRQPGQAAEHGGGDASERVAVAGGVGRTRAAATTKVHSRALSIGGCGRVLGHVIRLGMIATGGHAPLSAWTMVARERFTCTWRASAPPTAVARGNIECRSGGPVRCGVL
jgi:hypothetical protein